MNVPKYSPQSDTEDRSASQFLQSLELKMKGASNEIKCQYVLEFVHNDLRALLTNYRRECKKNKKKPSWKEMRRIVITGTTNANMSPALSIKDRIDSVTMGRNETPKAFVARLTGLVCELEELKCKEYGWRYIKNLERELVQKFQRLLPLDMYSNLKMKLQTTVHNGNQIKSLMALQEFVNQDEHLNPRSKRKQEFRRGQRDNRRRGNQRQLPDPDSEEDSSDHDDHQRSPKQYRRNSNKGNRRGRGYGKQSDSGKRPEPKEPRRQDTAQRYQRLAAAEADKKNGGDYCVWCCSNLAKGTWWQHAQSCKNWNDKERLCLKCNTLVVMKPSREEGKVNWEKHIAQCKR